MRFSYTAEKADGELYKGIAEAADRFELYQIVRREGGRITAVEEEDRGQLWNFAYWNAKFSTVKEYDKILFARNLGAMISAGLSLARALSVLQKQTRNPRLSSTISEIAAAVRHGDALHISLAKHPKVFSPLFIAMVRAGEESGDLSPSLTTVSEQMDRMFSLKKKVRSALVYPSIILVAIFVIGAVMMVEVVPTLAQTFAEMDAELPRSTQVVIGISNFLVNYTVLAIALVLGLIGGIYAGLRTVGGKRGAHFLLLQIPAIGTITREINAARTARTLASLSVAGVDILTSLSITREVIQNVYFKDVLAGAETAVRQGQQLSSVFIKNEKLYPSFVGEMMAVGEETGQTADMLKKLAVFYEDEVDRKTKDMSTVIEPFLMLFIGGAVGFFAVSMISPIYQLSQNI